MRGEYLKAFQARWKPSDLTSCQLEAFWKPADPTGLELEVFSDPWDPERYAAKPITNDMVTEVYVEFGERTRKAESDDYMRTLTGQ